MKAAIEQLKIAKKVCITNAPINEKRGNKGQAKLERANAKDFGEAITVLSKVVSKKPATVKKK